MRETFIVGPLPQSLRLDVYLARQLAPKSLSRGVIQKMIRQGWVQVRRSAIGPAQPLDDPASKLKGGEIIDLGQPKALYPSPSTLSPFHGAREIGNEPALQPRVMFENDRILALNKPSGLLTHPTSTLSLHLDGQLAKSLGVLDPPSVLSWLHETRPGLRGLSRRGLVHRLDAGTSGILLVAKTPAEQSRLSRLFAQRRVHKQYIALVHGRFPAERQKVSLPIGKSYRSKGVRLRADDPSGRAAQTEFAALKSGDSFSLVLAIPLTGRTHQIRLHLQSLGHPICGDPLYSPLRLIASSPHRFIASSPLQFPRMMLHAWKIEFPLPGRKNPIKIAAPVPKEFLKICRQCLNGGLPI